MACKGGSKRACKVEGCSRPVESLGLCGAHRRRLSRGKPLDVPVQTRGKREDFNFCTTAQARMVRAEALKRGTTFAAILREAVTQWCEKRDLPETWEAEAIRELRDGQTLLSVRMAEFRASVAAFLESQ